MSDDQRLVTVIASWDLGLIAVAEAELQNAGISYVIAGEQVTSVLPGIRGPGAVEIQVMAADSDAALELLAVLAEEEPS